MHAVAPMRLRGRVVVFDLLQVSPIKVLLLPQSAFARYSQRVQLPLVPDAAAFPHQDLGTADTVIFQ